MSEIFFLKVIKNDKTDEAGLLLQSDTEIKTIME